MADSTKIAIDALHAKALELLEDRMTLRRRLLEDAVRDQQIDRDLAGCVAGTRALGAGLILPVPQDQLSPPAQQQKQAAIQQFINGRNFIAASFVPLKAEYEVPDDDEAETPVAEADLKPEMPRMADIIIERLQVAGEEGSKAADIRRHILHTYSADFHKKTVGMTLYRLQIDKKVHREGQTWFLGPEPAAEEGKTPAGETPAVPPTPT